MRLRFSAPAQGLLVLVLDLEQLSDLSLFSHRVVLPIQSKCRNLEMRQHFALIEQKFRDKIKINEMRNSLTGRCGSLFGFFVEGCWFVNCQHG